MAKKKNTKIKSYSKSSRILRTILYLILILLALGIITVFVLALLYNTKFYPKTRVAGVNVNSMTQEEALKVLKQKIVDYQKEDLIIAVDQKQQKIKLADLGLVYHPDETLEQLFKLGHPNSFGEIFLQIPQIVKLLLWEQNMPLKVELTKADKLEALRLKLSSLPKPANFYLENNELKIKSEENGFGISQADLLDQTTKVVSLLQKEVPFHGGILKPAITADVLSKVEPKVQNILALSPMKLIDDGKDVYELTADDFLKLIDFSVSAFGITNLKLSDAGKKEVFPQIEDVVNHPGKPLKLQRNDDGSLTILQKDAEGETLDQDDLAQKLSNFLDDPQAEEITLKFAKSLNKINSANYKSFSFNDLIGVGQSTFYGSSENRVTNIKLGSAAINGVIVADSEIFSLGANLGEVSEATGYKTGWVIIGDSVDSEIGGGLCQVATTMFRSALQSGMEIVERSNHAYRVGYYEPPVGMDAAIYYPDVDLKFKNNTGSPILIQTVVTDYQAYYYIYGKSDGRVTEISEPQISNPVAPPAEIKYIDDDTLPVGTEVPLDSAHWGNDASFHYKVSKNGKILIETDFTSHYEAWPAEVRRGTKK